MAEAWDNVIDKLKKDAACVAAFEKQYPQGLSRKTAAAAIAAFEKTLTGEHEGKLLAGKPKAG